MFVSLVLWVLFDFVLDAARYDWTVMSERHASIRAMLGRSLFGVEGYNAASGVDEANKACNGGHKCIVCLEGLLCCTALTLDKELCIPPNQQ